MSGAAFIISERNCTIRPVINQAAGDERTVECESKATKKVNGDEERRRMEE